MSYQVREATLDDLDTMVHQRLAMFADMGRQFEEAPLSAAFAEWLRAVMPTGQYRAWLAHAADGTVAGGAGATIIPWPPGPKYPGNLLAFVFNVYTEPPHRRRGVARLLMETIHDWCRGHGVTSVALNASADGRPLYDRMGYAVTPAPMMFFGLEKV